MRLASSLSVDENFKLRNTSVNEILGVIIDRELKFSKPVKHNCKKADNRFNVFTKMANILNPFQNNFFSNLLLRVNSITAQFYACFVHARQTI